MSKGIKTEYDPRPVGVFDSGFGGVSFLRNALIELPSERFIYFGDNKNAPYGDRSEEEILCLAENAAESLVDRGVKTLVVACNTATSAAINVLRERLSVPVVSVEPAIKPACRLPGGGKVLMLATLATTRLSRYRALQARMPDPSRIINVGCPGIVDRIEKGEIGETAFDDILSERLGFLEGAVIDGIVLGCTHFPFIAPAISRYASMHFKGEHRLFDGNAGTARQLKRVLESEGLSADPAVSPAPRTVFLTSGDKEALEPIFDMLLKVPISY
ncbi:MAG: glutamate racemase [Clostridia bacterium]|nr:glutamate racemase [Clostridia bacterium]